MPHDGIFHADELAGVAQLIIAGYQFKLVRTRDKVLISAALKDPSILLLDNGFDYNPEMNNHDHHQDLELPSAAGLIYKEVKELLLPEDQIAQMYFQDFIDAIDAVDVNRNNIYAQLNQLPKGFRNVSSIMGGFNTGLHDSTQEQCFINALNVMVLIMQNEIHSAKEKAQAERDYSQRVELTPHLALFEKFSPIWKEKNEFQFAILPHHSGWQLQTRDSSVAVVPESVNQLGSFIFRHGSGFMATASDLEELKSYAIEHIQQCPECLEYKDSDELNLFDGICYGCNDSE